MSGCCAAPCSLSRKSGCSMQRDFHYIHCHQCQAGAGGSGAGLHQVGPVGGDAARPLPAGHVHRAGAPAHTGALFSQAFRVTRPQTPKPTPRKYVHNYPTTCAWHVSVPASPGRGRCCLAVQHPHSADAAGGASITAAARQSRQFRALGRHSVCVLLVAWMVCANTVL